MTLRLSLRSVGCCRRKEGVTPTPWGKLFIICLVFFVSQFGINLIFPFLPYMIHDFFPELDRTQIGQKAGYLGMAYFLGNLIGSLFWGYLSDVIGRRPSLLWGLIGIICSELLFAFSQNFAWAVIVRLLWGMLNGNIGIGKTYISDISDDTNQARGYALVGVTAGTGQILGSVVGGLLSQPASKYSALQFPIFCQYPYCLPVLIGATMGCISLFNAWLFMDETLHNKKRGRVDEELSQEDSGIDLAETQSADPNTRDNLLADTDLDTDDTEIMESDTELLVRERLPVSPRRVKCLSSCNPLYPCIKFKQRITECVATPIALYRYCRRPNKKQSYSLKTTFTKDTVSRKAKSFLEGVKKRALLMVDRRVFFSTLMYGVYGFVGLMSREIIPLILVTNTEDGGYSFDDTELGIVFMISGITPMLYHLFMFPMVTKLIGFRNTFRLGVVMFAVATFLLPFSNQITGAVVPSNSSLLYDNLTTGSGDVPDTQSYCNHSQNSSFESNVNENSVLRVPFTVWLLVTSIITVTVIGRLTCIACTMVLINNSSLPETKGMVNGIGQALASIGRAIGPAVGAPLFAWSENTGLGWPLNFHFVFDLMVVSCGAIILLSFALPKSIERKREPPPARTDDSHSCDVHVTPVLVFNNEQSSTVETELIPDSLDSGDETSDPHNAASSLGDSNHMTKLTDILNLKD